MYYILTPNKEIETMSNNAEIYASCVQDEDTLVVNGATNPDFQIALQEYELHKGKYDAGEYRFIQWNISCYELNKIEIKYNEVQEKLTMYQNRAEMFNEQFAMFGVHFDVELTEDNDIRAIITTPFGAKLSMTLNEATELVKKLNLPIADYLE